jgi:mediator of RNA polymerase II transcription subunit 14
MCFTQAADSLFFTHEGLQQARAPVYDVPSALEVLLTGTYRRLPKCIEDMGMQTVLSGEERELALPKLDTLLRSRLLEVSLPKEISNVTVSDGRVVLHVEGEFKVQLTLGYRGHLSLWRILHVELLVGERSGPLKLTEMQRFSIGDDLERRMAAVENPFAILYSVLHEFCIALVIDTMLR